MIFNLSLGVKILNLDIPPNFLAGLLQAKKKSVRFFKRSGKTDREFSV